ncbi:MAG: lytic transglycosylase domain-containing protein [Erythrobacter sp.]
MSSMVRTCLLPAAALAALVAGLGSAPVLAQASGDSLVARQGGTVGPAVARWEQLQANRELSFGEYAGFVLAYPDFPRLEILRIRAENALDREAPPQSELLRFFDAFPPLTNNGRARYALALASAQRPEAIDMARAAWRGGAMADPAEMYLLGLYQARFSAEDHAARVDALLVQGKADAASRQIMNLAEADRPMALARLALLRGTLPEQAGLAVPFGAMSDPGYVTNYVKYLRGAGRNYDAVQVLANRQPFVRPVFDPEDFVGLMLTAAKSASASDAARIASRIDDIFAPGTDISQGSYALRDRYTDLMWLGGTSALWSMGDGTTAAPLFSRYGEAARTPLTKSKGYYWAGRAARRAGLAGEANSFFERASVWPHYYYGQLSLSALGRPMPQFAPLPVVLIDEASRNEFDSRPLVRAIRSLAAARRDWRTERRFFEALGETATSPQDIALVNMLAAETGMKEMAVVLGMKAGEMGLVGYERLGFPTLATPPATNWTMVHAIGRQESEFDRTRVSHAGARGIMQLMPGTAREQAGKLGVTYLAADLIDSPSYNIQLGDGYFQRMLNYYGGSYPLAIGAYNAGPGRVNEWLRLNGDPRTGAIDYVTWIEKIPANFETRYYIMRVLGNAVTYSHMYPDDAGFPRPIDSFLR